MNIEDLYVMRHESETWRPGEGSLWIEVHRRVLENNRILRLRWPHAARALTTFCGADALSDVNGRVPAYIGCKGIGSIEEAVDAAFRDVAANIPTSDPRDRSLLDALVLYDDVISGRTPIETCAVAVFPFDVVTTMGAIEYYLESSAWPDLIRSILPPPDSTVVEVEELGSSRILRTRTSA